MKAILDEECFPAGMEMFPASDNEQFEFIKTVIDKSDYYILIIAGKYGVLGTAVCQKTAVLFCHK